MALGSLITATNTSFADLASAYRPTAALQNVRISDYVRNGLYVPSYTGNTGITATTVNITLNSFRSARPSPWLYRDTFRQPVWGNPAFQYRAGDSAVISSDIWENNTSTFYVIRSGPKFTSSTVVVFSGGSINSTLSGDPPSWMPTQWSTATTVLESIASAAYNSLGSVILTSFGQVLTQTGTPDNGLWTLRATWGTSGNDSYRVRPWNTSFVAVKMQNSGGPIDVRVSSDAGLSWSNYTIATGISFFAAVFTISGGRAFIHGTNGMCFVSTNPTSSSSWTRLTTVETVFSSSSYANAVAYNAQTGVCLVGGQSGLLARSTTLTNDFVSVTALTGGNLPNWSYINGGYIDSIRAYQTGFIAQGTYLRSTAWSPDGLSWTYGIGTNAQSSNTGTTISSVFSSWFYNNTLDRLYIWYAGGYYLRNDGSDLQFTLNGSTKLGISGSLVTLTFNNSDTFALVHGTGFGQEAGLTLEPNGAITQLASGNPPGPSFGPGQYLNTLEPGIGSEFEARLSSYTVTGSGGGFVMNSSITAFNQTLSTPWVNLGAPVTTYITPSQGDQIYLSFTLEIRRIGTGQVISRSGFAATDNFG